MPDKRIEELTKKLETAEAPEERAQLCREFWEEVKKQKSPFIEEMPNGNYRVSFLYQDEREGLHVLLDCIDLRERLMDAEGHARQFTQIPGTDIYVLELEDIPADTCIPYELEVNGGRSFHDVNNTKKFQLPTYNMRTKQTKLPERESSILILPEAQVDEQVWSKGLSQEKGSVESRDLKDETGQFGERTCWIYKPHHFDASNQEKYKLLLVLDGEAYIPYLPPYLDSHPDESANVVVAFIGHRAGLESNDQIEANRKFEYITQGPAFANYLVGNVLIQLRQDPSLHISSNPQDTLLAGFSMAGYCAAETGLDHSDEIGHVILLSPALNNHHADIVQRYAEEPTRENLRVYQSVGKLEDRVPDARSEEEGLTKEDRVSVNRRLHEVLQQKGYESTYAEPAIGHTELMSIPFLAHSVHQVLLEEKKHLPLSEELFSLFMADQQERSGRQGLRVSIDPDVEKARRDRTFALISEMEKSSIPPNEKDYYYAAVLFNHGTSYNDKVRAYEYARKSFEIHFFKPNIPVEAPDNRWLMAATYDRTQLEHDPPLPQKYGTQRYAGGDKEDLLFEASGYSIDEAKINEARHEIGLYSLEEAVEREVNPEREKRGLPPLHTNIAQTEFTKK